MVTHPTTLYSPLGDRTETVEAMADTGSTFTVVSGAMLEALGVKVPPGGQPEARERASGLLAEGLLIHPARSLEAIQGMQEASSLGMVEADPAPDPSLQLRDDMADGQMPLLE